MIHFILISFFFLFSGNETEWKLKKEKSGIEVYTRIIEGSSFAEFKGMILIPNTDVYEILDILFDVENYESLFPDCINSKLLEQAGKYHKIHYIVTKGPWPVTDRDAIYDQKAELSENGKYALIRLIAVPDKLAENEKMVRMQEGSGSWELDGTSNKNVKVTFQFHGEPRGIIPTWLVNSFVVNYPFQTLENLRDRVKKQKKIRN